MTALIAIIGLYPVKDGINEDPSVPLGFAGMTAAQLESDNAKSFRLIDVQARFGGLDMIISSALLLSAAPRIFGRRAASDAVTAPVVGA